MKLWADPCSHGHTTPTPAYSFFFIYYSILENKLLELVFKKVYAL